MRLLALLLLSLLRALPAAEAPTPTQTWPLWDGTETVEQYAKRVNLPPTQTLDLGNNVKLELLLIPAGQFIMGTPTPALVDEFCFRQQIIVGQAFLAAGIGALLVLFAAVALQALRRRQRPNFSLLRLLAITVAAGVTLLSALHWRQAVRGMNAAQTEYRAATARFALANDWERPAHPVTLTQPFYMGKFAVTQEQYRQVVGRNRSRFPGANNPAERVSWIDAQTFCERLRASSGRNVRLPTDAEAEFACRAGTTTAFYSGDSNADGARVAWSSLDSNNRTHPVGQKEPNAFGLYDMHGNVWQWCEDRYGDDYYARSPVIDPQGAEGGESWLGDRILRGGSWSCPPSYFRSAVKIWGPAYERSENQGFRVAVSVFGK